MSGLDGRETAVKIFQYPNGEYVLRLYATQNVPAGEKGLPKGSYFERPLSAEEFSQLCYKYEESF